MALLFAFSTAGDAANGLLFGWDIALTRTDNRWDYGEARLSSIGFIKDRLHVCIW